MYRSLLSHSSEDFCSEPDVERLIRNCKLSGDTTRSSSYFSALIYVIYELHLDCNANLLRFRTAKLPECVKSGKQLEHAENMLAQSNLFSKSFQDFPALLSREQVNERNAGTCNRKGLESELFLRRSRNSPTSIWGFKTLRCDALYISAWTSRMEYVRLTMLNSITDGPLALLWKKPLPWVLSCSKQRHHTHLSTTKFDPRLDVGEVNDWIRFVSFNDVPLMQYTRAKSTLHIANE